MSKVASSCRVLIAAASVLTVSSLVAEARDLKVVRKTIAPVEETQPAKPIVVRDITPATLKSSLANADAATAPSTACARKVKVVYAGYGEAALAECTLAAAETPASAGLQKTAAR